MNPTEKLTGKEVEVDHPNTIKQLQNLFGCHEECDNHCMEAYKIPVWFENSRQDFRKLCQLKIENGL